MTRYTWIRTVGIAALGLLTAGPAAAETLTVTALDDRGPGTLRDALELANALGGATIQFAVAGTITVASALPALRAGGITIDGCTAPGVVALERDPAVTTTFDGLRIESADNSVRCLTVRNFLRDGISLVGARAVRNLVEDTTVSGSGDDGIGLAFGAQATIRRNVVTGSVNKGVLVHDRSAATVVGNTLAGNRDGVSVTASASATIEGNTVQNNADNGVAVKASTAEIRGNEVRANRGIGIWVRDPGAQAAILANTVDRNGNHGIGLASGVTAGVDGNVITNNNGAGIWMKSDASVTLGVNTFSGNVKGDIKVVP